MWQCVNGIINGCHSCLTLDFSKSWVLKEKKSDVTVIFKSGLSSCNFLIWDIFFSLWHDDEIYNKTDTSIWCKHVRVGIEKNPFKDANFKTSLQHFFFLLTFRLKNFFSSKFFDAIPSSCETCYLKHFLCYNLDSSIACSVQ